MFKFLVFSSLFPIAIPSRATFACLSAFAFPPRAHDHHLFSFTSELILPKPSVCCSVDEKLRPEIRIFVPRVVKCWLSLWVVLDSFFISLQFMALSRHVWTLWLWLFAISAELFLSQAYYYSMWCPQRSFRVSKVPGTWKKCGGAVSCKSQKNLFNWWTFCAANHNNIFFLKNENIFSPFLDKTHSFSIVG